MDIIKGKVYTLSDDVDTDQIIPAHHLVYDLDDPEERSLYGQFALSGVPETQAGLPQGNQPFVQNGAKVSEYTIIIGGKNFGCGSSREHAPVALNMAGVKAVVAVSYARIFYRNSIDGGFIVPFESQDNLSGDISTGDEVEIDPSQNRLINISTGKTYILQALGEISNIVESGGIFEYAKKQGFIE